MKRNKFDFNQELAVTHNALKKILQYLIYPGTLIILTLFSIIKLLIPFWKYNNLYTWDMAGHLFSTWFLKEYLYPAVTGWNPFFFAGFPQNQFYTPLFSYISATLAQIFTIETSIKLVVSAIIILTPISVYYFLRALDMSKKKASLITGLAYGAFYFVRPIISHFGGDFYSTFNVGLVSNALGLVLVFFYLGSLLKNYDKQKFIVPSILFSLLILSHIFSAVFGLIVGASFLFYKFLKKRKFTFSYTLKHYLLVFGLTAFWTLPFLTKISETATMKTNLNPFIYYVILAASVVVLIGSYITKKEKNMEIATVGIILSALVLAIALLTNLPFHHYRLIFMSLVIFMIILFSWFKEENTFIYGFIITVLIFLLLTAPNIDTTGPPSMNIKINSIKENPVERTYIIANTAEQTDMHILQNEIPRKYRINGLKGLYVESSPTSVFVQYLEKEIDPNSMIWGVYVNDALWQNKTATNGTLPYQLDYLGVTHIISTKNKTGLGNIIENLTTTVITHTGKESTYENFYLYQLNSTNIIEVLNYVPETRTGDWMNHSVNWFMTQDIKKGVIVFEDVPKAKGTGKENITLQNISRLNDRIDFHIDSKKDVPLLIKISYFPNWKAYSEGKQLKIYRASPNIMLLYGHGDIHLRYEPLIIDTLSSIISMITIILLAGYYINKKVKREKNEKKRR